MESERSSSVQIDPDRHLLGVKLRRGISLGAKGGPRTPVPTWKMEEDEEEAAAAAEEESDRSAATDRRRRAAPARNSVSARKLGANLWEVQGIGVGEAEAVGDGDDDDDDDVSEISHSSHQDRSGGRLRRHISTPFIRQKLKGKNSQALQPVSSATYSSSVEVAGVNRVASYSNSLNLKGMIGEEGYSLRTSTELLKVLNRIWSLEEQQSSNESLVKALKVELKHARARIQELLHEQKAYRHEMGDLMKQVAEDKQIRKKREHDKIKMALQSIRDELEDERKIRKRSESLHRKLGKELSGVKMAFSKALKDLDREKEANSLLEDLCDEFAKGVGDFELEVRDRDHKADRMVLHISEAWLDGRLQMKVAEARGDVDEKNKILDRLSHEIMKFLQSKRSNCGRNDISLHKNGSLRRQSLESLHLNGATSAPQDGDDDSIASDVHCFELNLGENGLEKIDETRLSNVRRNCKMAYFERIKGQSSSNSQVSCNGNSVQLMDRLHSIHSCKDADLEGEKAKEGCLNMKMDDIHILDPLIDNSVKKQLGFSEDHKDHHHHHLNGNGSHNQFSRRGHTVPNGRDNASGSFYSISSPVQQWRNLPKSPNAEISECSSKLPKGVKENTLKAKLLEARLEGQYARLKASKSSSTVGG